MFGKHSEGFGKHLVSTSCSPQKTRNDGEKDIELILVSMVSTSENIQTRTHARTHPTVIYRLPRLPLTTTRQKPTTPTYLTNRHTIWLNRNMAGTRTQPQPKETQMTKSSKINAIIEQATRRGLNVTVETEIKYDCLESISVSINMGITEINNMLDVIQSAESIHIYAIRTTGDNKARAFKLTASKYYGDGNPRTIKPTNINTWVGMMGNDLAERNKEEVAA